ncbi:MAG TPA: glucose 1-dehydrogenase [Chloroflexi bacterium]|jgi:NAD(P)-dependent dehydrogenase (short-subunit alcohol dehydrogenase family)|nr:glucose 1-dehydrogenase [Chloroflexota bacterium]
MGKLDGQVALVTGAARGLGRAYALHLASLGADVVVNDIDLHAAKAFGEELTSETVMAEIEARGRRALGIEADATQRDAVEAMVRQVLDTFGRLDILVNNAGGALGTPRSTLASDTDEAYLDYILDVNLKSTILCCQAASRPMKAARYGRIVNVGSQAGLWSGHTGDGMPYKVAKAGVIHYTRVLASELGPYGINVNCIAPAWILSSRAVAQGRNTPEIRDRLLAQIPLGRLGVPEDCAKVVEFLVTDLSDYVTGQTIAVCGGYVCW